MGVLQTFERRLGGLVEGAFARVFKGEVQPAEIASALQRESDDRKEVVARGRVLAPNAYVVELGDRDYRRLAEWAEPLGEELAAMVKEHAAENGYSFVGPVDVGFEHRSDIGTGVFRIRSGMAAGDEAPQTPAPATRKPSAAPAGTYPQRPRLILTVGDEESAYFLTHAVTVIGRASECDVRIEDSGVSRKHAEIRYSDGRVGIVDLGSTNGLTVNGKPAERVELKDGDRIDIGHSTLIFRRDEG
ncbi:MAG: FhaA domain-containing protein [Mycobacteriales bacterium]